MFGELVGNGYAANSRQSGGDDAFLGVFQDDTFGRLDAEQVGGFEKDIGERFYSGHVQTADDRFKIVRDVEPREDAVDGVTVGGRSQGEAEFAMQTSEQFKSTIHRP